MDNAPSSAPAIALVSLGCPKNLVNSEEMLALLYGDGTRPGLVRALTDMRKALQEDEKELRGMTDGLLRKLGGMTDEEYEEAMDGE